jgi:hypothetical protein
MTERLRRGGTTGRQQKEVRTRGRQRERIRKGVLSGVVQVRVTAAGHGEEVCRFYLDGKEAQEKYLRLVYHKTQVGRSRMSILNRVPVFEHDHLVDERRLCGTSLSPGKTHRTMLKTP